MKLSDLMIGETYWHTKHKELRLHRDYCSYPVRVEDLTRYSYTPPTYGPEGWTPDQSAYEDPKGRFIRVIVPGDPTSQYARARENTVAYVEPRNLKGTLPEVSALVKRNQQALKESRDASIEQRRSAEALRDSLRSRAANLGMEGWSVGLDRFNVPHVSVSADRFVELLDRMEREAEHRCLEPGDEYPDDLPHGS